MSIVSRMIWIYILQLVSVSCGDKKKGANQRNKALGFTIYIPLDDNVPQNVQSSLDSPPKGSPPPPPTQESLSLDVNVPPGDESYFDLPQPGSLSLDINRPQSLEYSSDSSPHSRNIPTQSGKSSHGLSLPYLNIPASDVEYSLEQALPMLDREYTNVNDLSDSFLLKPDVEETYIGPSDSPVHKPIMGKDEYLHPLSHSHISGQSSSTSNLGASNSRRQIRLAQPVLGAGASNLNLPLGPAPLPPISSHKNSESEFLHRSKSRFVSPPEIIDKKRMEAAEKICREFMMGLSRDLKNAAIDLFECSALGVVYETLKDIPGDNYYEEFKLTHNDAFMKLKDIISKDRRYVESNATKIVGELKLNKFGYKILIYKGSCYDENGILWKHVSISDRVFSFKRDMMEYTDDESSSLIIKRLRFIMQSKTSNKADFDRDIDAIQSLFHLIRKNFRIFMLNNINFRRIIIFGFLYDLQSFIGIRKEMNEIILKSLQNNKRLLVKLLSLYFREFLSTLKPSDDLKSLISQLNQQIYIMKVIKVDEIKLEPLPTHH